MQRNKNLKIILDDIKDGDNFIVFILSSKYEEDKKFIEDIMKPEHGNGIYRVSRDFSNSQKDYFEKAKLVLFFNTKEQLYFGWGLLDSFADIKKEDKTKKEKNKFYDISNNANCDYGPFDITDEVRDNDPADYPENLGDKFDKKFYKFNRAKLLDVPLCKEEFESSDCAELVTPVSQASTIAGKVKNHDIFKHLLLLNKTNFKKPEKISLSNSLIEQIDSYDIENVHTAFLKNFLSYDNIYKLNDKPIKLFIDLIKEKCIMDNLHFNEIKKEKFIVKSQERLTIESGNKIQPDIVLEGDNYRIIVEVKYYSSENNNQTLKYYEYFETKSKNEKEEKEKENNNKYKKEEIKGRTNIYVYLKLKSEEELLSADEHENKKIYNKILFKDLVKQIYISSYKNKKNIQNEKILYDYLNSFCLTANPQYKIDIEDVPFVYSEKYRNAANEFVESLIKKHVPESCGIAFKNLREKIFARYLLVIYYNTHPQKRDVARKIYNSIKPNR